MSIHETEEWRALLQHYDTQGRQFRLSAAFEQDSARAGEMSTCIALPDNTHIFFDYSKNLVSAVTIDLLVRLARRAKVEERREAMFAGDAINGTENRAVLHVALRGTPQEFDFEAGGVNVGSAVCQEKKRFLEIAERVRSGEWKGWRGDRITDVVNIGIGGSDLGPAMVCAALGSPSAAVRCHFVSNIDGGHLGGLLSSLRPETTLFIIVSKTFTTQETLRNAETARQWLYCAGGSNATVAKHFVAVSTNAEKVRQFGINVDAGMVGFWEWVGGRYSVWSAVGLAVAISIGGDAFEAFLAGARSIDKHFRTAPLQENIPALMGLLGIWYSNFHHAQSQAVLPYEQALSRLPAYLQQLEMESNGKSTTTDGNQLSYSTCPVIWGEPGTNGQHAFFQLLHQGTLLVPCDFLAGRHPQSASIDGASPETAAVHHKMLLANFLAQSRALMLGKPVEQTKQPYRTFVGNRPSTAIVYDRLTPMTLGALIALYEHKVFVQGVIWNVNSFDQFGVELGKEMANELLDLFENEADSRNNDLDPSTRQLLHFIKGAQ